MSTEIYYFSGTGNSLYVAKELQRRISGAKLIPIISLLNDDVIKTNAETIGMVFPIHLSTIPIPVRLFLNKLDIKSSKYLFAVATRGGTIHRAFIEVDNLLKRKGTRLDAYFTLNFIDNNPRFDNYLVPTLDEIDKIKTSAQVELSLIQNIIQAQEESRKTDTTFIQPYGAAYKFLLPLFTFLAQHPGSNDDFYADLNCSGCGICEKICLSQKVIMVNDKPDWQADIKCYSCRACLNYCPTNSVQIRDTKLVKSYTSQNGRYPHPFATINEIVEQKSNAI